MKKISVWILAFAFFFVLFFKTDILGAEEVVIYTSLDQTFSEPVLRQFEKETGIKVKSVYDVEATKTTGLVNRLLAEKDYPQCDVFWNSEIARTIMLKTSGVLAPYASPSAEDIPAKFKDPELYWTGFAARARVLVYNTNLINEPDLPASIFDLTKPEWKKRFALAYPLFGTTATHMAALRLYFGKEKIEQYLRDLKANQVVIVNGNASARDAVVEGEVPLAFTDTDDVHVALAKGEPVAMHFPDQESFGTLFIPNTVALIKNGPNPEAGKKLIDYLLKPETESVLAHSASAQIPVRPHVTKADHTPDISTIKVMEVDYSAVAGEMEETAKFSRELFVR